MGNFYTELSALNSINSRCYLLHLSLLLIEKGMTINKFKQFTFDDFKLKKPIESDVIGESKDAICALNRFSLKGKLADLEKQAVEAVPILDNLVLQGQFVLIYAQANTGKTLLALSWIINAIESGAVNPDMVFYMNLDDTSSGLIIKLNFAEEYGFHMLADGEAGFKASNFLQVIKELIDKDQCHGRVIVVDTLKKVVDVIHKSQVRVFTGLVRNFVQKGGTLLALAHTNKRPDANGKVIIGGVGDLLDDCDCAYIAAAAEPPDANSKMIVFENIKKRGDVDLDAAFLYSNQAGISYAELVTSVEKVKATDLDQFKVEAEKKTDAEVIAVIADCIREGINTKMKLVKAVGHRIGVSKRAAIKVIEKYTGTESDKHVWTYTMKGHGAQQFELI